MAKRARGSMKAHFAAKRKRAEGVGMLKGMTKKRSYKRARK